MVAVHDQLDRLDAKEKVSAGGHIASDVQMQSEAATSAPVLRLPLRQEIRELSSSKQSAAPASGYSAVQNQMLPPTTLQGQQAMI